MIVRVMRCAEEWRGGDGEDVRGLYASQLIEHEHWHPSLPRAHECPSSRLIRIVYVCSVMSCQHLGQEMISHYDLMPLLRALIRSALPHQDNRGGVASPIPCQVQGLDRGRSSVPRDGRWARCRRLDSPAGISRGHPSAAELD